ncbi:MAG: carbohydrate binding family 9 domain-containing protein [Myxococcota bacterium]
MPLGNAEIPLLDHAGIEVDGRADESAWQRAVVVDGFATFEPAYDLPPTGTTVARVIADERGLWFHVTATDPDPDRIRAAFGRRDARLQDDWCGVYVDPAGDGQRSYQFVVSALGVQADGTLVSGAEEADPAWDGRWWSAARRTDQGYEVEFGVPWRTVRHPRVADRIGLFFVRHVSRSGETSGWPRLDPNVSGQLVQQAVLGGPGELPKTVGLDIIPEVTYGVGDDGPNDDRLGFAGIAPGVTVRYAPSAALQLLGTFNPDFSQVESDEAQIDVNRRYRLSVEEKRPFFLDGQEWFDHPFENLVYTRSMVAPEYGVRATAEADGWAFAALHVLDGRPGPSVVEHGGWTEEQIGGGPAFETVLRGRRTVGADSYVGIALSDREVVGTALTNRVGAVDARVRLSDGWSTSGALLGSTTSGIGAPQLAPAGTGSLVYGSKHLGWELWGDGIHPAFRAENGFVTETDRLGAGSALYVRTYTASKLVPRISPYLIQGDAALTTDGQLKHYLFDPGVYWALGNGGFAWTGVSHAGERFAGADLVFDRAVLDFESPWARWLTTAGGFEVGTAPLYDPVAPAVGWQDDVWATIALQPVPEVSLELIASWERFLLEGVEQYAGWVARARLEVYLSRRVFARAIVDRSGFDGTLGYEGLVAWEHSPGTALYVGGRRVEADPWSPPPEADALGWEVFAKASWVFGL